MNKQFLSNISLKRLRLFSFLSVTCLAVACIKDPEGLGGDLVPQSDLIAAFETDTIALQTKLVWVDSVLTDRRGGNGSVLIGSTYDPLFGQTSCAAHIQFDPLNRIDTIPEDYTVTGVYLDLAVLTNPNSFGTRDNQRFKVELLTEQLYFDSSYYGFTQIGHETDNLLLNNDPVPSYASLVEDDGKKTVLRLKLQKDLGELILQAAIQNKKIDTATNKANGIDVMGFREGFKGLRISTLESNGNVTTYIVTSSLSRINVEYMFAAVNTNPTISIPNRKGHGVMSLGFSNNTDEANPTEFYTETTRQFLQSPMAQLQETGEFNTNSTLWMQAGFVACEVDYSSVADFLKADHVLINNCDLVVPIVNREIKNLPDYLAVIRDQDYLKTYLGNIPSSVTNEIIYNGFFRKAQGNYRLDVTSFLRAFASRESTAAKFYLVQTDLGRNVLTSILAGPAYHPTDRTQNMRMVLTYTNKREE